MIDVTNFNPSYNGVNRNFQSAAVNAFSYWMLTNLLHLASRIAKLESLDPTRNSMNIFGAIFGSTKHLTNRLIDQRVLEPLSQFPMGLEKMSISQEEDVQTFQEEDVLTFTSHKNLGYGMRALALCSQIPVKLRQPVAHTVAYFLALTVAFWGSRLLGGRVTLNRRFVTIIVAKGVIDILVNFKNIKDAHKSQHGHGHNHQGYPSSTISTDDQYKDDLSSDEDVNDEI